MAIERPLASICMVDRIKSIKSGERKTEKLIPSFSSQSEEAKKKKTSLEVSREFLWFLKQKFISIIKNSMHFLPL